MTEPTVKKADTAEKRDGKKINAHDHFREFGFDSSFLSARNGRHLPASHWTSFLLSLSTINSKSRA
jgi:hypothetical protein